MVLERTDVSLSRWRAAFDGEGEGEDRRTGIDYCPWPGPRPLDRRDALVGRDDARTKFLAEVSGHKLIVLSGSSGVGKSSLLQAGLIPDLRAEGYQVATCTNYSGQMDSPPAFVAKKVHRQFPSLDLPDTARLFPALNEALGKFGVIVFDQFEELIRYAPTQKDAIFGFLVNLNHSFETKVIISLRDEYLHELREVEKDIRSFSLSRYILDDIDPAHALDIVKATEGDVIEDEAASIVAGQWRAAQRETINENIIDPYGRIGLLHLQAYLYSLHAHQSQDRIDADAVNSHTDLLRYDAARGDEQERDADSMAEVFKAALRRSVSIKLERCQEAACEVGFDSFLVQGATDVVARSVVHLSSAGYKLIREAGDLAQNTMDDEVNALRAGTRRHPEPDQDPAWTDPAWNAHPKTDMLEDAQYDAMLRLLLRLIDPSASEGPHDLDLVSSSRSALGDIADLQTPQAAAGWRTRLHASAPAWVADPNEVTCGPMSGMGPAAVLIEELRRFAVALAWMREASLIRITTPTSYEMMVSLIHDGFGQALKEWAQLWNTGPDAALHALTAPLSASFVWEVEGADVVGRDRTRVIANLRWRGGYVRSRFANVLFVNCDLRGTLFDQCSLEGVTFVNCLMDGTIFSDCRFVGDFKPFVAPFDEEQPAPVFIVDVEEYHAREIAKYRETARNFTSALYSPLPGAPAVPGRPGSESTVPLHLDRGGATIYGGRLSALVVRRCDFREGGLSLRYTTGSGLELVEMSSGKVDLHGAAVRQLTISSPLAGGRDPLRLTASASFLAQTWIGDGLLGTFDVQNCKLMQVWNESDVDCVATDSTVFGLLGVRAERCIALPEPARALAEIDSSGRLSATTRKMDYRRNPAREDAAQRRLGARAPGSDPE